MKTNRRLLIIAFSCLTGGLASASFGQPTPGKAATLPAKASYQIDAKKSRFIVETETTGLSAMFAHDHKIGVRDFTGQATFMRDNPRGVSLSLTVQANSLYLLGENDIGSRQSIESALREDVLETAKYPEIVFKSRSVTSERRGDGTFDVRLTGDLKLHGVKRTDHHPGTRFSGTRDLARNRRHRAPPDGLQESLPSRSPAEPSESGTS